MIPCIRGKSREKQGIGQFVADGRNRLREVVDGRKEHQAVQIDGIGVRKVFADSYRTGSAVGFARDVPGRAPASVPIQVKADKIPERADVVVVSDKAAELGPVRGTGVAGPGGIDKDKVRDVEQRVFVIRNPWRHGQAVSVLAHFRPPGAQAAEFQIIAAASRSAVEGEGDRALRKVLHAVPRIGPEEKLTGCSAGLDGHGPGCRGVGDLFAVDQRGMFGRDEIVLRLRGLRLVFCKGHRRKQGQYQHHKGGQQQHRQYLFLCLPHLSVPPVLYSFFNG